MRYLILSESSIGNLEIAVEEKLVDGWELYGFPWHGEDDRSWYYYQAMIKKTPNIKEDSQNNAQHLKAEIIPSMQAVLKNCDRLPGWVRVSISNWVEQLSAVE